MSEVSEVTHMTQVNDVTATNDVTELVNTAKERPGAMGRRAVPWLTAIPLAVLMAYGDGFWMTTLRGAVGAIERTQGPFASWLRESTLILPVYLFAVLGALTLALRWFGPALSKPRTFVATALMIAAAGTLVGGAELAASSAYDYQLQSNQLQIMHATHHITAANYLASQEQASFALQVQAVVYGAGILLVTNLVLVCWAVAMRGGRLNVSATRAADSAHSSRSDDLRLLLAAGFFASAAIHA